MRTIEYRQVLAQRRQYRTTFFDLGSVVIAGVVMVLTWELVRSGQVDELRKSFPASADSSAQSYGRLKADADAWSSGPSSVLWRIEQWALSKPYRDAEIHSLRRRYSRGHFSFDQTETAVQNGAIKHITPFRLQLKEHEIEFRGRLISLVAPSFAGNGMLFRPRQRTVEIEEVKGLAPWNISSAMRDGRMLLKQLERQRSVRKPYVITAPFDLSSSEWGSVRPIQSPLQPSITVSMRLPQLSVVGHAALASDGSVRTLLSVAIDGKQLGVKNNSFAAAEKAAFASLPQESQAALKRTGVAYAPAFLRNLIATSLEPIFARDRVRQAMEESYDALTPPFDPVVALEMSAELLRGAATGEFIAMLQRAASANKDLKLKWGEIALDRQQIRAHTQGIFSIPQIAGRVDFDVAAIAAMGSTAIGIRVLPAIENLAITGVSLPGNPDLADVIRTVNEALTKAIGYANLAVQPVELEIAAFDIKPIDLTRIKEVTSATPSLVTFPKLRLDKAVFHADASRLRLLASLTTGTVSAIQRRPHPEPANLLWAEFSNAFATAWNAHFPDDPSTSVARVAVRTDFIAGFINDTWNTTNPTITATERKALEPTSVPFVPPVSPTKTCDLDCDKRCCTDVGPIRVCEPTCSSICGSLLAACWTTLGTIDLAGGLFQGTLDLDLNVGANAKLFQTKLTVAPDLSRVDLAYSVEGSADFWGVLTNRPRRLSYLLCVPTDLSIPFPTLGRSIHLTVPSQSSSLGGSLAWRTQVASSGKSELNVAGEFTTRLVGQLSPKPIDELTVTLNAISILCPVNASAFLGGIASNIAQIIRIGSVTLSPSQVAVDTLLRQRSAEYRLIVDGALERDVTFKLDNTIVLPDVVLAGNRFKASAQVSNGLIKADLTSDIASDRYPPGLAIRFDYSSASGEIAIAYPLISSFASSSVEQALAASPEVKKASVAIEASPSAASNDQLDFGAKVGADLQLRYTRQEAEAAIGGALLQVAIARGWVIPEYNAGQLIAVRLPVTVSCNLKFGIAIPVETFDRATLELRKDRDPVETCSISGDIARYLDLQTRVKELLNLALNSVPQGLVKARLVDLFVKRDEPMSADELIAASPLLAAMRSSIMVRTKLCQDQGQAAFCLSIGFPRTTGDCSDAAQAMTFECQLNQVRARAVGATTPATKISSALRDDWASHGFRCPTTANSSKTFPSKAAPDGCDDGDMALFGGLLCASSPAPSVDPGCELVRDSQGPNGQWWRSPNRIGTTAGQSDFSGDMTIGVLHYLARSNARQPMDRWRNYILGNRTTVPNAHAPAITFYRTCSRESEGSCTLSAEGWFALNAVATRLGLGPPADSDLANAYGHTTKWLPILAALTPAGYRLHLVGVQIYLLKQLGVDDPYVRDAAKIVSGRDPENPFFAYLAIGADQVVQILVEKYCPLLGASELSERSEWTWERRMDTTTAPWKKSMYWDCVFMANLVGIR